MIGRLTGKVVAQEGDAIVVDVGGVGYEVVTPLGTVGRATTDASGAQTFYVHTHVREDVLQLFGFATEVDRAAFRTLIGVSNVGPKTAVAVLSALPAAELARTIQAKDVGKLTSISGVGKKTAERLVLELRDKIPALASSAPIGPMSAPPTNPTPSGAGDLLMRALTNMGYRPAEAERAIDQLPDLSRPLPDLIKEALGVLAK
jgi:Holliday junction DNA helicase RuvA